MNYQIENHFKLDFKWKNHFIDFNWNLFTNNLYFKDDLTFFLVNEKVVHSCFITMESKIEHSNSLVAKFNLDRIIYDCQHSSSLDPDYHFLHDVMFKIWNYSCSILIYSAAIRFFRILFVYTKQIIFLMDSGYHSMYKLMH
jgi:hypothetical protein